MSLRRYTTGIFCCALGLATGWAAGQTATTQPAKAPQPTEFKLSVIEVVGPMAELKDASAEELAKKDVPAQPRRGRGRSTPGAEFGGQIDLSVPAKLVVAVRLPMAAGRENRKNITYVAVKTQLTVWGSWKNDQAEIHLNFSGAGFGVPGVTSEPKNAMNTVSLDRVFTVDDGKSVAFKFEDKPQAIDEETPDQGRIHVGTLTVKKAAMQDTGAGPNPGAESAGTQQAMLELETFAVSAERAALNGADLNKIIAGSPSGAEILKRLGELGEAHCTSQFLTAPNLTAPQRILGGARIPVTQDIHISATGQVTPSITYQEMGTILATKAGRWERIGDQWVCDLGVKLQASTTAESGLMMPNAVQLPTFVTTDFDAQKRFQSGRAEYFLIRGEAGQGEKGKAPVWVARMVLTRAE